MSATYRLDFFYVERLQKQLDAARGALQDAVRWFEDAEKMLAKRDHVDLSDSLRLGKQGAQAVLAAMKMAG